MNVYLKTFGCRVNQSETESLRERIVKAGHKICENLEDADSAVINGCSVTGEADKDCARLLRLISRRNPKCRVIVTGCYATVFPQAALSNAPSAELIPNPRKQDIPSDFFGAEKVSGFGWKATAHHGHSRAFVKIQDGCKGGCKYCIVPQARAELTSKSVTETLDEIRSLADNGYGEIVLSGINIGNYNCPETGSRLETLLENIWKMGGCFRVRLSSIEPRNINDALIKAALLGGDRFCEHFHIPLQAGSDKVLSEMGRVYDSAFYLAVINKLKKALPSAGIYCDIIAGYPTETDEDFEAGFRFVESAGFAGLHVFRFCARPGSQAAKLKALPSQIVSARAERLRALDKELRRAFAAGLVGTAQILTVESGKNGAISGLTGSFVNVELDKNPGTPTTLAKINSSKDGRCFGTI